MNKILELAMKLKRLWEQGEGGEKLNAETMLKRLMVKHEIRPEMLEEKVLIKKWWRLTKTQVTLFMCVVSHVSGVKEYNYNGKGKYGVLLTHAEIIEVDAMFNFYWLALKKDLDLFQTAFIHKNKLYAKEPENKEDEEESKPLTDEQKVEVYKLVNIMQGMDRHHFHKQINN